MKKILIVLSIVSLFNFIGNSVYAASEAETAQDYFIIVSPLIGAITDKVTIHTPVFTVSGIQLTEQTIKDTAPETGIFLLFNHRCGLTLTDTVFYADVNNAEITGNVFHADYIYKKENRLAPYLGGGHLYHIIKTSAGNVELSAALLELGLQLRLNKHFRVIPFLGYMEEHVETPGSNNKYDALLYGAKVYFQYGKGFQAAFKLYKEDVRGKDEYLTVKARVIQAFSPAYGMVLQTEYAEHIIDTNYSVLIGPFLKF